RAVGRSASPAGRRPAKRAGDRGAGVDRRPPRAGTTRTPGRGAAGSPTHTRSLGVPRPPEATPIPLPERTAPGRSAIARSDSRSVRRRGDRTEQLTHVRLVRRRGPTHTQRDARTRYGSKKTEFFAADSRSAASSE